MQYILGTTCSVGQVQSLHLKVGKVLEKVVSQNKINEKLTSKLNIKDSYLDVDVYLGSLLGPATPTSSNVSGENVSTVSSFVSTVL